MVRHFSVDNMLLIPVQVAQFWMCMQRSFIQQLRNIQGLFIDNFLILFAATALGIMYINKVYEGPPPKGKIDLFHT